MGLSHYRNCSYLVFKLLLLVHFCFEQVTTAVDTITVNQSLRDPDTMVSDGKRFKLGFFTPPGSSYRYVGVMYNVPVLSVVWVANRNSPLKDSMGSLEVSSDGNLVILDGRNDVIWSTYLRAPIANSSAVLLDTGNLVLQGQSSTTYVWESFQHPSDSLLERMKMFTDITNEKTVVSSWRSANDPSPGSFNLTFEPVVVPQAVIWKKGYRYWRSGLWNGQTFTGLSSFPTGVMTIESNSSYTYEISPFLRSSALQYYVLNASGNLLRKTWHDEKGEWEVMESLIGTECDIYGRCGPSGICDAKNKPVCTCLRGFVPKSNEEWKVGNWSSGCIRNTSLQCEGNNSSVGKHDGFVMVNGVKLPDHFEWSSSYDDECRMQCLRNCSCGAYAVSQGIGCLLWSENLIDVQRFSRAGDDLYIRLAYSELGNKNDNNDKKAIIPTTVILGFFVLAVCSYFLLKFLIKYRARKRKNEQMHGVKVEDLPMYTFQMLSNATRKFDLTNKLGQGGFGPVFKGILPNGQEIAVKRLERSSKQGLEEFMNEVKVISKLQHRNLVRLLGCCVESEEKMLVYEYMPNGSLDAYLFDPHKRKFLDWKTREDIVEGICRGLLYLHRDSRLRIIHRDLKASNILLDEELNPKISDFGMARIFGGKDDQANTTRVVGTYGYMSPEYALHGIFSEKSDVYSFGVLLLEIVSGKRSTQLFDNSHQLFLIAYAWNLWDEQKMIHLMDAAIYDPEMADDMVRYANVGLLCVEEIASDRPTISTVLSMLSSDIAELPCPKRPAFLAIRRSTETKPSQNDLSRCSLNDVTVTTIGGR